jgi:ankyrin repeat protein
MRDDSFFGSPSRAATANSPSGTRRRAPPVIASPFNPKANRSTLELVRIADYRTLDSFLDGCTLVAVNEQDKKAGRTALMVAVLQQKIIPIKMLLEAGADLEIKDNQGKTALAHAAGTRNIKSINLLLAAGADINPLDANGLTPLDQAEMGGDEEVFELLKAASSPRKRKKNGSTSFEESKAGDVDKKEEAKSQSDKDESPDNDVLMIDCE